MAQLPTATGLAIHHPVSSALSTATRGRALMPYAPSPAVAPVPVQVPVAAPEEQVTLFTLADLFRHLRRHWKLSMLVALPLAALTFCWLGTGPKVYESEARLLLRIQDGNPFNFADMARSGSSEVSAPMLVNNHRAELLTRSYGEYLLNKIPAEDRAAYIAAEMAPKQPGLLSFLSPAPAQPAVKLSPDEIFLKKLSENTRVEPVKESHILRILLRGPEPVLVARLANAYANEYINYAGQQDVTVSKKASAFLEQKGEELRQRLQDSENKLSSYRQSHNLIDAGDSKDLSSEKSRLLTEAIAAAEVRLTTARQNLETIRQAQTAGRSLLQLRLVADNASVSATRKDLETAQAELGTMRVLLGARHPKVLQANGRIETLKQELIQEQDAVIAIATSEEANTGREVTDLHTQLDAAKKDLLAQGGKTVEQKLLTDRVSVDRELYQKIELRTKQANLTGDFKDSGELRESDIAVPAEHPVKPSKPIALLASFMVFGLIMGGLPVGIGLASDYVVPSWKGQTAAPVTAPMAAAPSVSPAAAYGALATVGVAPEGEEADVPFPILARLPELPPASPSDQLAALLSDAAAVQGSLGPLCGSLMRPRQGPCVLLILSAERAEGKTILASTLAGFLTMNGQRVLLMDCNPDAPALHRWLRLAPTHSSGASDLSSLRYGQSNLFVLPGHDLHSYDLHDLVSGYAAWIGRAQNQVDWIVIDGPSILRNYADSLALTSLATDVVMVHDPDHTPYQKFQAAMNLVQPKVDASLFRGMVLNRQRV